MAEASPKKPVTIDRITRLLPHRYPFLLVDRVIDYELHKWLQAVKNVSVNEPFFNGHFPGYPVMPGVLILEAMAQASGVLAQLAVEQNPSRDPLFYLVKIDKARFNRTVIPGDQLCLEVHQKRMLRRMGQYEGIARVDGNIVASAEIMCAERVRDS